MLTQRQATLCFWTFIALHVLVWTLYPILNHWALPDDMIENFYLGKAWQWGYYKHPPLFSWVVAGYLKCTQVSLPNYYFLSQLNVAFTFSWFGFWQNAY